MESLANFLVFALFVGNFSSKHQYILLKFLRIFCFSHFCPKWLFPKLFVLKFDVLLTSSRINLNYDCSLFDEPWKWFLQDETPLHGFSTCRHNKTRSDTMVKDSLSFSFLDNFPRNILNQKYNRFALLFPFPLVASRWRKNTNTKTKKNS